MSSEELLKNKRREKEGNQYKSSYHNKGKIRDGDYTTTSSSSRRSENKKLSDSNLKISIIKSQTFIRGCLFILGFSIVFVALGASITAIGSVFHEYTVWIERIGGILLIIFGLNLLGVLKYLDLKEIGDLNFLKTCRSYWCTFNRHGFWCRMDTLYWSNSCKYIDISCNNDLNI